MVWIVSNFLAFQFNQYSMQRINQSICISDEHWCDLLTALCQKFYLIWFWGRRNGHVFHRYIRRSRKRLFLWHITIHIHSPKSGTWDSCDFYRLSVRVVCHLVTWAWKYEDCVWWFSGMPLTFWAKCSRIQSFTFVVTDGTSTVLYTNVQSSCKSEGHREGLRIFKSTPHCSEFAINTNCRSGWVYFS